VTPFTPLVEAVYAVSAWPTSTNSWRWCASPTTCSPWPACHPSAAASSRPTRVPARQPRCPSQGSPGPGTSNQKKRAGVSEGVRGLRHRGRDAAVGLAHLFGPLSAASVASATCSSRCQRALAHAGAVLNVRGCTVHPHSRAARGPALRSDRASSLPVATRQATSRRREISRDWRPSAPLEDQASHHGLGFGCIERLAMSCMYSRTT
jgi:hypothetical protein